MEYKRKCILFIFITYLIGPGYSKGIWFKCYLEVYLYTIEVIVSLLMDILSSQIDFRIIKINRAKRILFCVQQINQV